jgi:hypothetical protein
MVRDDLSAYHGARGFLTIVLPSVGNMVFVPVLFVLALSSAQRLLGDGDSAYHIRTGELILETLRILIRFTVHLSAGPRTNGYRK